MTTQKKTTIGGQAIIEGIVMKGPKKSCTVVRKANGELVSKTEPTPSRAPIWEKPIFRGACCNCRICSSVTKGRRLHF